MAFIMLHNLCLDHNDPCKLKWRLEIKQLGLTKKGKVNWLENNDISDFMELVIFEHFIPIT